MFNQTCPECRLYAPRILIDVSKTATVTYYRCDACGHVWTLPKTGDLDDRRDVTRPFDLKRQVIR